MSWSALSPFIKAGISWVDSSALITFYFDDHIFQMIFKPHTFQDSAAKILRIARSGSDSAARQFNPLRVKLATAFKVSDSFATS